MYMNYVSKIPKVYPSLHCWFKFYLNAFYYLINWWLPQWLSG